MPSKANEKEISIQKLYVTFKINIATASALD